MNVVVGAGADELLEWALVCARAQALRAFSGCRPQVYLVHDRSLLLTSISSGPTEHGGKGRYQ